MDELIGSDSTVDSAIIASRWIVACVFELIKYSSSIIAKRGGFCEESNLSYVFVDEIIRMIKEQIVFDNYKNTQK